MHQVSTGIHIYFTNGYTNYGSIIQCLAGLLQLFSSFHGFIAALYVIVFGAIIGGLEFRVPPETQTYGSFLFSFAGRGVFYTVVALLINGSGVFRIVASTLVFIVGIGYIALEFVPSISPPDNMTTEGLAVGANDDDVI